jgi:hypothetical protein
VCDLGVTRQVAGHEERLVPAIVRGDVDRRTRSGRRQAPGSTNALGGVSFAEEAVLVPAGGVGDCRGGLVDRPARQIEDRLVRVGARPTRVALHPGTVFVADPEGQEGRCQGRRVEDASGASRAGRQCARRCHRSLRVSRSCAAESFGAAFGHCPARRDDAWYVGTCRLKRMMFSRGSDQRCAYDQQTWRPEWFALTIVPTE